MNQGQGKICKHIKSLNKQTLKGIVAKDIDLKCAFHRQHSLYYLCLHCGTSLCLQYRDQLTCLKQHQKCYSTHIFYVEIEYGSIWCSLCDDSIQNMLFSYAGDQQNQDFLKLTRFQTHITSVWTLLIKGKPLKNDIQRHAGLKNLGNTCYLNVVLQSLFASGRLRDLYASIQVKQDRMYYGRKVVVKQIEYFYDDLLDKKESQIWNVVRNKKQKKQSIISLHITKTIKNAKLNICLKQLFNEMSKKDKPFAPVQILALLGQINSKYQQRQQQDADELLLLMIDVLNEGERLSFLNDLQRYRKVENVLGYQKLSPIQQMFGFYLLNQIQCNQCKQISSSINLSYNISLSLQNPTLEQYTIIHKEKIDVDYWQQLQYPSQACKKSILQHFFKVQRLNKTNNYYQCTKCKSLLAYRQYYMISQPEMLVISVKRFDSKLQKKSDYLQFSEFIQLDGITLSSHQCKYRLYSIIVHEGRSITNGHYICFIRLEQQWYLCSDDKVHAVDWNYVQSQQAYILLYQKQQSKQ